MRNCLMPTKRPTKVKKVAKKQTITKPEIVERPESVIIDHHTELEIHFEEYEMSRAPGS